MSKKKLLTHVKQNTDRNHGIIVIVVASNFQVNENETLCTLFPRLLYNISCSTSSFCLFVKS